MLHGKKILLGISGSIAAYKSITLLRLLVKSGADVKIVMTPAARDFVSPLTLSTLSHNTVLVDLFDEAAWANHVMLGRWADLFVVAPLSCNTLAKMAMGICDNLLLATYLSATCPVWVAPAMDEDMWQHPTTIRNLAMLQGFGNHVIPVNTGELASGLVGPGRMAEPEDILLQIQIHFAESGKLAGKKVLVTAGPTYEPIDPVRFIGNHSSGKMGLAIAHELAARGAEVQLVAGPGVTAPARPHIQVIRVNTAAEMYSACLQAFEAADIAVMAAAVADYSPVTVAGEKIKKKEGGLVLELQKTKDILKELGNRKKKGQFLVGFALETNNEKANALEKLSAKNADLIVLNSLKDEGAGFGNDTNKITIYDREGGEHIFPLKSKSAVAADIVGMIIKKIYA
ncbi:bifunctional phosphopantothenoylcysteine decarboxylase/phosphopantothenate--cysteine ligase CoaBC [Flavihumibacter profundi]|jgi:phosphopantothenoylcysteine decarboxylase / phosphopantothenate---cysteine ligase|uniref:bifunctional phosphopantothenoylcysteine decarboxylase/phosphopantothenate--cysteine ligase CoaBC n=1 Tax=Flavihumibacter profundi TaxID=2716883 RepID=UPI001CC755F8|nr:bifunctional phosphopantothenoylcysteine decarboxylase/phosphopantothenate--cysteine ligase CoaBC [Flavihumibacter profundi]MBZ5857271.1 bifunctional phosphopantothenoylcysteine decarboxylase/phosphopantothenate--cysteine ligase CoaBC [Flavihumibacter profundi]